MLLHFFKVPSRLNSCTLEILVWHIRSRNHPLSTHFLYFVFPQMDSIRFQNYHFHCDLLLKNCEFTLCTYVFQQIKGSRKAGIFLSLKIRPHILQCSALYANVKWMFVGTQIFPTARNSSMRHSIQFGGSWSWLHVRVTWRITSAWVPSSKMTS